MHCAAPRRVLGNVISVNSYEHEHAFPNLADDLLVDGDARALDALQHEAHCACVGCEEQQESGARQRTVMGRLDSVTRSRACCETFPAKWLACVGAAFLAPAVLLWSAALCCTGSRGLAVQQVLP